MLYVLTLIFIKNNELLQHNIQSQLLYNLNLKLECLKYKQPLVVFIKNVNISNLSGWLFSINILLYVQLQTKCSRGLHRSRVGV